MQRSLVTADTATLLLDFLASGGSGDQWTRSADLVEWSALHNVYGERNFVPRLAQILASRGLAEVKRAPRGVLIRLTQDGLDLAFGRNHRAGLMPLEPIPDDAMR
jgi:hypothetical protein